MKPATGYLTPEEAKTFLLGEKASMNAFYTLRSRMKAEGRPMKTHRLRGRLRFRQVDLERLIEPLARIA